MNNQNGDRAIPSTIPEIPIINSASGSQRLIFTQVKSESVKDLTKDTIMSYYPKPKRTYNKKHNRISINKDILEQDNLFKCFLCDSYIIHDNITTKLTCSHPFCSKCGKVYYEGLIEEGKRQDFLCPMYACKAGILFQEVLAKLVSLRHLNLLPTPSIEVNDNKMLMGDYRNWNVIDVNSNEQFFKFSYHKNKHLLCPKCKEMSLYGKTTVHYIKCLNCFLRICKYCSLEFGQRHLEIKDKERCKVYFRRQESKMNGKQLFTIKSIMSSFLIIISGYILICVCPFIITCQRRRFQTTYMRLIRIALGTIASIILMPILIMTFPYYPILTCIVY